MTEIKLKVTDQHLRAVVYPLIASGGENENRITVEFEGHEWDGYVSMVAFNTDRDPDTIYTVNLDANNQCVVPWEVTESACTLFVAVAGTASSDVKRTTEVCAIEIVNGAGNGNAIPAPPTPTVYDNLIALINAKQDLLVSGTNIKTVNSQSLLGSGNITTVGIVQYEYGGASFNDLYNTFYSLGRLPVIRGTDDLLYFPVDMQTDSSPTLFTFATIENGVNNSIIKYITIDSSENWGSSSEDIQEKLISGTNIKTINNISLLGSGDITISGGSDLFECTWEVTTFAEITQALSDGKLPYIIYNISATNTVILFLTRETSTIYYFRCFYNGNASYTVQINNNNLWSAPGSSTFELSANKITTWQTTPDNTHYPSEKLVYDSIQAITDTSFTCIYGTTTYAEIQAAIQSGKDPVVFDTLSGEVFHFAGYGSNEVNFSYVKTYSSGSPQLSVEFVTINMSTSDWTRGTPFVLVP